MSKSHNSKRQHLTPLNSVNDNGGRRGSVGDASAGALKKTKTEEVKTTIKVHKEWVWAKELTEKASTYRKTLIG